MPELALYSPSASTPDTGDMLCCMDVDIKARPEAPAAVSVAPWGTDVGIQTEPPTPTSNGEVRRPADVVDAAVQHEPCHTFDRDAQAGTGRWDLTDAGTQSAPPDRRDLEIQTEECDDRAYASLDLVRSFAAQPTPALLTDPNAEPPRVVNEVDVPDHNPTTGTIVSWPARSI